MYAIRSYYAVQDSTRATRIPFGEAGHERANVDVNRAGRSTEGMLLLNAFGFKFSELDLVHDRISPEGVSEKREAR